MRICDRCASSQGVNRVGWSFRLLVVSDGKENAYEQVQHSADLCGVCTAFMKEYGLHRAVLSFIVCQDANWLLPISPPQEPRGVETPVKLDADLERKIDAALDEHPGEAECRHGKEFGHCQTHPQCELTQRGFKYILDENEKNRKLWRDVLEATGDSAKFLTAPYHVADHIARTRDLLHEATIVLRLVTERLKDCTDFYCSENSEAKAAVTQATKLLNTLENPNARITVAR